jgi:hypothetical protein
MKAKPGPSPATVRQCGESEGERGNRRQLSGQSQFRDRGQYWEVHGR